jgi:hypothetical protein
VLDQTLGFDLVFYFSFRGRNNLDIGSVDFCTFRHIRSSIVGVKGNGIQFGVGQTQWFLVLSLWIDLYSASTSQDPLSDHLLEPNEHHPVLPGLLSGFLFD